MPRPSRRWPWRDRHRARASTRERDQRAGREAAGRGFRRTAASPRRHGHELALTIRRESEAGLDVLSGEVGEVAEDLVLGHPRSKILQHIRNGDAQAANTG